MKSKKVILAIAGLLVLAIISISAGLSLGRIRANKSMSQVDKANDYVEGILSNTEPEDGEIKIESDVAESSSIEETVTESSSLQDTETSSNESVPESFVYVNDDYAVPDELPTESITSENESAVYVSEEEIIATFDENIRGMCLSAFNDSNVPLQDLYKIIREVGFLYPTPYMIAEGSTYEANKVNINFTLPGCRANAVITKNGSTYITTFRIMDHSEYTEEAG